MAAPASQQPAGGPSPDGSGVYNPQVGYLNAEARRTVGSPTFQVAPSTVQLPRDTVLKRMLIKAIISVDTTYAAGSPVTSELGIMGRICPNVELNINGNRIVKSVNPYLVRLQNILMNSGLPRRAYGISAAAPTTSRASREWMAGTVAYPATTEFLLINEAFELSFENPLGYGGSRQMSELDIRDVASADLRFTWAPISNILRDGNAASVTYGTPSVVVVPQIIENRARPRPQLGQIMYDYVETSFSRSYTGQSRNQQIDLQTGNFLMGVGIFCRNGDSGRTPQENLLTNLALRINGSTAIQGTVSHQDLQDSNVSRFGAPDLLGFGELNSTIASVANVHPLRGFAFMNLIRNGDWNTAINTSRQAGVDSIKIELDTPAASGTDAATYTNPLEVTLHTHEIRPFAYST